MRTGILILAASIGLSSCTSELPSTPDLFVGFEFIDDPTTSLSPVQRSLMDGVYDVVDGTETFGPEVVGRWIGNRWSLHALHDAVYAEMAGGFRGDSTVNIFGYVREVRSGSGTRLRMSIAQDQGGRALRADTVPSGGIRISGSVGGLHHIELRWKRRLYDTTYHVLAHRGGGRNSDRLGFSENSIPMILHAPVLGATGVEIDVKRTRDGKIIVFHDDSFSPRTVQGAYLLGKVTDFDLAQIKALGRLVNGETIPTLDEALAAVIRETQLNLVWLDVKDPSAVSAVIGIQQAALRTALAAGRTDLRILLGIPTTEVLDAYRAHPDRASSEVLVELGTDIALAPDVNCKAWAPIWTVNITDDDVRTMRARGILVFTWTVDLRESMVGYLGRIDGVLTNYPSLLSGLHYSRVR